jgi:hydrogenase maturation protease
MNGKLLIAGVGNIFLGDDGFGAEVASRLASVDLPDWVRVVDYGIRGMHLAYDLAGYSSAILVDATARGGTPGAIYVIEPESQQLATASDDQAAMASNAMFNAHGMQPDVVLSILSMLEVDQPDDGDVHEADARQVLVIGCEPACVDYGIGLSPPVAAAVDEAVTVVTDLVTAAARSGPDHRLVMKEWAHVPRYSGRGN